MPEFTQNSIKEKGRYFARKFIKTLPFWQEYYYASRLEPVYSQQKLPSIYLETTSACNLNCVMCPTQRASAKIYKKSGYMKKELFCRLIDEIASDTPDAAVYLYKDGEPLLHPQILEFIDYATSSLSNVTLFTNATLLNDKMAQGILSKNLNTICFSIDGLTKQTFEKVRMQDKKNPFADPGVPVDFDSVINNVLKFCEFKKSLGKISPKVVVRTTSFKATEKELADYRSYWEQRVDAVEIAPLLSWSGKIHANKRGPTERVPCDNLWKQLVVNWDGTVAPCCIYVRDIDNKFELSDLNTCSMRDAINSAGINRMRLAHLDNKMDDAVPFCKACTDWRHFLPTSSKIWTERFKKKMRLKAIEHI